MNSKQFLKYLDRDRGCVHCGDIATAVPHHRLNRGMGGSKKRDVPSNIVALCATVNGLVESDTEWLLLAREMGWKLRAGDNPASAPCWNGNLQEWVLLGDDMSATSVRGVA